MGAVDRPRLVKLAERDRWRLPLPAFFLPDAALLVAPTSLAPLLFVLSAALLVGFLGFDDDEAFDGFSRPSLVLPLVDDDAAAPTPPASSRRSSREFEAGDVGGEARAEPPALAEAVLASSLPLGSLASGFFLRKPIVCAEPMLTSRALRLERCQNSMPTTSDARTLTHFTW